MERDVGKTTFFFPPLLFYNQLFSNALRILGEFSHLQNAWDFFFFSKRSQMGDMRCPFSQGKRQKMVWEREMHRLIREKWKKKSILGRWGPLFRWRVSFKERTKSGPPVILEKGRWWYGKRYSSQPTLGWAGPLPWPGVRFLLPGPWDRGRASHLHTRLASNWCPAGWAWGHSKQSPHPTFLHIEPPIGKRGPLPMLS